MDPLVCSLNRAVSPVFVGLVQVLGFAQLDRVEVVVVDAEYVEVVELVHAVQLEI
jgi:hypothetical protein